MIRKLLRKIKYLILFLSCFCFMFEVKAEIPTGEQYSEFATHRVGLVQFLTYATNFMLYGYDYAGHTPSLSSFTTGTTSLVRYENNGNDNYGVWAIRVLNSYHSVGTYSMSWRVTFDSATNAGGFCNKASKPSVTGGTINSMNCSVNGTTAYLLINYDLTVADTGVSKFDFAVADAGMSANWFMRLATAVYYPQIIVSEKFDTSGLENQNQIIINQNQTTINQNQQIIDSQNQTNQKIDETNEKLNDLDDTLNDTSTPDIDLNLDTASDTPISDLVTMPLTLLNKFVSTLNGQCVNYTLPFFYNQNVTLTCFTISDYLGQNLTNLIDMAICLFMCYNIAMLAISIFEDITSLRDTYDSLYVPQHGPKEYQPKHGGDR